MATTTTTTTATTTCSINFPSPSLAPPNISKPTQTLWNVKAASWRKQCFVGMTCMIIGSEMVVPLLGSEGWAMAENMQIQVEESKKNVVRWSDTRACPPWQLNSLETIVPENLPRPSSHRRSESVTTSNPTVRLKVRTNGSCFSM